MRERPISSTFPSLDSVAAQLHTETDRLTDTQPHMHMDAVAVAAIDGPLRPITGTAGIDRGLGAVAEAEAEAEVEVEVVAKVLVVGNAKCGKSSVISRYTSGCFNSNYRTTIGADFVRKDVLVDMTDAPGYHVYGGAYGGKRQSGEGAGGAGAAEAAGLAATGVGTHVGVRVQMWDIAGQDRFQKLTRAYFSNARAVVIVCDVSREGTIEAVQKWKAEVDRCTAIPTAGGSHCRGSQYWDPAEPDSGKPRLPCILLANKADLLLNAAQAFKLGATMERLCAELGFLSWYICSARTGEALQEAFASLLREVVLQDCAREMQGGGGNGDGSSTSGGGGGAFRLSPLSRSGRARPGGYGSDDDDDELALRFTDCC